MLAITKYSNTMITGQSLPICEQRARNYTDINLNTEAGIEFHQRYHCVV